MDSNKITDTAIYNPGQNIRSAFLLKNNNLIQFENKKILLFNKRLQHIQLPARLKVDYIYLTGNPQISLNQLNKSYVYTALVIDGSNLDRRIADWEKQAKELNINYRVIKRNKSLVVLSN